MKNLILINGTMGVGKTATSMELQKIIPENVFLDGDWCWNMRPFVVNGDTKRMVLSNITYLLDSFVRCPQFKNIIFCWVMHEQEIIDKIISGLDLSACRLFVFSLTCSEAALTERIKKDMETGRRSGDVLERALSRSSGYKEIDSIKIDVSDISPADAARKIKCRIDRAAGIASRKICQNGL